MITNEEQQATLLSATKKDYYQIWNELMDTAKKLSERWDPTTTNESDPGIVLLKVLTAVADKLNYNIDKNILEAFMPSAAQEDSMRKLCDMMGYNMAYYKAATTEVTITYDGDVDDWYDSSVSGVTKNDANLRLPIFTEITNVDQDIVYTTTASATFSATVTSQTIECIEGTLSYCAEDNDNVVTIDNLDDNNRYYLPVSQVAENGVFIYNVSDGAVTDMAWARVDNLNTQELESKVYKFGYDSAQFLPYVEFPSDISSLIEDGLLIAYITTNGINGNVSANTLTTFDTPSEWTYDESDTTYNSTGVDHESGEFSCTNVNAATNGADKESIDDAYCNFKKTVGTFDTLVTCRDYMNKIYQLTTSTTDTTPLVANSIVSDIRDDINKAITICTFSGSGLKYTDKSLTATAAREVTGIDATGVTRTITITEDSDLIDNFDLVLYPFTTVPETINTTVSTAKSDYDNSFRNAGTTVANSIIEDLKDYKTISHVINNPVTDEEVNGEIQADIMCIKNYLRLNAKISTTTKITTAEWGLVLTNIKKALFEEFSCRQLDFGEEIPFDDILETIENADTNIKNVSLEDPDLYTSFMLANNKEYVFTLPSDAVKEADINQVYIDKFTETERSEYFNNLDEAGKKAYIAHKKEKARELYIKLAIRNILAGRVELFNYNSNFTSTVAERKNKSYETIYPTNSDNYITKLEPSFEISSQAGLAEASRKSITLTTNQIVQFRAPNYKTTITYPAYVNYFIKLKNSLVKAAVPATFITLKEFISTARTVADYTYNGWQGAAFLSLRTRANSQYVTAITDSTAFSTILNNYGCVYTRTVLYPVAVGAISDIFSGNYYLIPTVTFNATINAVSFANYDGKIYKIEPGLRCNSDGTLSDTGSYLKLTDAETNTDNGETIAATTASVTDTATGSDGNTYYYKVFSVTKPSDSYTGETVTYYEYAGSYSTDTTYYYYPFESITFGVWRSWIQTITVYEDTDYEVTLSGIYKQLTNTSTASVGELVDKELLTYQLATSYTSTTENPLEQYYIQKVHIGEYTAGDQSANYTQDGLGADAEYSTLTANTEYQLDTDEYLCINYTEATTTTDTETEETTLSTTSTVVNTYYGKGTIIKPNFAIMDSEDKHETTSYSKTTGYSFDSGIDVPGMFSLGTDEQIEIRDEVTVYVYDSGNNATIHNNLVYVYFNLNSNETVFLENGASRILEENEYFWYTDKNKSILTYCGEGSEVFNYTGQTIEKSGTESDVSIEDILTNGISTVPWISIANLFVTDGDSPNKDTDKFIKWKEYQYVELVEGDTLSALGADTDADYIALATNSTDWTECKSASYTYDGADSAESLPALLVENDTWMVRTLLKVAMSSTSSQTLNTEDNYTSEAIKATFLDGSAVTFENVTLKSNYTLSHTTNEIDTTYDLYDENNQLVETVTDFELKVFTEETLYKNATINDGSAHTILATNNIGGNYTNLTMDEDESELANITTTTTTDGVTTTTTLLDLTDTAPYTILYSTMANAAATDITTITTDTTYDESHSYSLIMFYYETETKVSDSDTVPHDLVHIRVSSRDGDEITTPFNSIYNYTDSNGNESWWLSDNFNYSYTAYEDSGLRIYYDTDIGYDESGNQLAITPSSESDLSTWVSGIDVINKTYTDKGLNKALAVYKCTMITADNVDIAKANPIICWNYNRYYLTATTTYSAGSTYLAIYTNVKAGADSDVQHTFYCLKPGINIIKLSGNDTTANDLTIEVYAGKGAKSSNDIIVFGQLDNIIENHTVTVKIVEDQGAVIESDYSDYGINLELLGLKDEDSESTTKTDDTTATELLSTIEEIDKDGDFYYSMLPDSSTEIDINTSAGETLAYEPIWYDYNNVNNKFVISEIDSDYLDTGITLARTSSK